MGEGREMIMKENGCTMLTGLVMSGVGAGNI